MLLIYCCKQQLNNQTPCNIQANYQLDVHYGCVRKEQTLTNVYFLIITAIYFLTDDNAT